MKIQRLLIVLTLVNLTLLVVTLAAMHPAAAEGVTPVLRSRALEIVDEQGRVRAFIKVYPASRLKDGETYPETVLLRLITASGGPAVKLSASERGAILLLGGPSNTKETYAWLGAYGTDRSLKFKNEDGREQIIKP